ncbi:hypothetical protein [Streptomyces sp. NPDC050145]|uniref:hypothetical protein n=1 Tax=Streptomyces sp. NPDC050145 TaxID=3365602 RepID=UPI0037A6C18B
MNSPTDRAARLETLLQSVLATSTHVEIAPSTVRVTAPVPDDLDEHARRTLLRQLDAHADRFGHETTRDGAVLWVEIDTEHRAIPMPRGRAVHDDAEPHEDHKEECT